MRRMIHKMLVAAVTTFLTACGAGMLATPVEAQTATTTESPAPARTPTRAPIRVLTWNLEHFVDPYDDPYVDNPIEDVGGEKSPEDFALIAQAIKLMDADVMALQEVEGDRQVKLFLDTYLPGHTYRHFASITDLEWYQNTVIASRFPIGEIVSLREVSMFNEVSGATEHKYNNRLMFAEIRVSEDYSFFMANLHLKAGRTETDIRWRELQTDLVHETLRRRKLIDPNKNLLVTGDMNFMFDSREYNHMLNGGPVRLHDVMADWNIEPITRDNPRSSRIDHIFVNGNMMREYVPGSGGMAQPLPFSDLVRVSDHFPYVASFYPEDL